MSGAVAHVNQYKEGQFFSHEFVGDNSWNGFERNCLFASRGDDEFIDVGRATATDVQRDSRSVGAVDLDGDGRLDLVIANNNAAPEILMNRLADAGNWVEIDLRGAGGNQDAVGARARLTAGGKTMTRMVEAGSGYASQGTHTLHFGLGAEAVVDALEISWPDGHRTRLTGPELTARLPINSRSEIRQPASGG